MLDYKEGYFHKISSACFFCLFFYFNKKTDKKIGANLFFYKGWVFFISKEIVAKAKLFNFNKLRLNFFVFYFIKIKYKKIILLSFLFS